MKWEGDIMQKIINFSKANQDVLPHLEKQPNMSSYIASLIRADMQRKYEKEEYVLTKEQVVEIIKDVLRNQNIDLKDSTLTDDFPLESMFGLINMEV